MKCSTRLSLSGIILIVVIFVASYAWGNLDVGIGFYYFTPAYGEVNADLGRVNSEVGTNLEYKAERAIAANIGYDISEDWEIRGEIFILPEYGAGGYSFSLPIPVEELAIYHLISLNAVIISGIYKVPSREVFYPYVGGGVGLFSTSVEGNFFKDYGNIRYIRLDTANSIGFQIVGGVHVKIGKTLSARGEARYIIAKAERLFENEFESTSIEWNGPCFGMQLIYTF